VAARGYPGPSAVLDFLTTEMNQQSIRARSSLLGPDQPGPVDVGGRGNSWWEMRLRDARGRRMTIRLNGLRSADRQQFIRALQPYLDRSQVQVEGPFAEASGLVAAAAGLSACRWWQLTSWSVGRVVVMTV
jgi:hypothetical protein